MAEDQGERRREPGRVPLWERLQIPLELLQIDPADLGDLHGVGLDRAAVFPQQYMVQLMLRQAVGEGGAVEKGIELPQAGVFDTQLLVQPALRRR